MADTHRMASYTTLADAIESKGGVRGTLVDAFGVYADPAMSAVLNDVPIRALPSVA